MKETISAETLIESLKGILLPKVVLEEKEDEKLFKRAKTLVSVRRGSVVENQFMIRKMCRVAILLFFTQIGFTNP
jgi:hypothetical protein